MAGRGAPKGEYRIADPSYETLHARLNYAHGRASQQVCEDCGEQAQEWAYDHSDAEEKVDPKGRAYSLDLARYRPLCVRCHRQEDSVLRGCQKAGHPWTPESTYYYKGQRMCRTCRTEYAREWRSRHGRNCD